MPWKLTVRTGPRVEHSRFAELDGALDALELRAGEIARSTPRKPLDTKVKRFEPIQQVAARIELCGPERVLPRVRVGVDVRGDGSTEAYLDIPPGIDLKGLMTRRVGVRGTVHYNESLRARLISVRDLEPLDKDR